MSEQNRFHRFAPESPESLAESFSFANSAYSSIQIASVQMKSTSEMLEGLLNLNKRDQLVKSLWTRIFAWIITIEDLRSSKHYQAIVTGTRAILELTVDMLLLCRDRSNATVEKMHCFMESEKLRNAELLEKYFEGVGQSVPPHHRFQMEFLRLNKTRIQQSRNATWPTRSGEDRKHPERWSCRDLWQDVQEVDTLYGDSIIDELGQSLSQFYRTSYRQMNWDIHSGYASTFMMPAETFDIRSAFAMLNASSLAMLATYWILREFRFNDAIPNFNENWKLVRGDRDRIFVELLRSEEEAEEDD